MKSKLATSRFVVLRLFPRSEQSSIRILNLSIDIHIFRSCLSFVSSSIDFRVVQLSTTPCIIVYNFSKIILPREKFDRILKNYILYFIKDDRIFLFFFFRISFLFIRCVSIYYFVLNIRSFLRTGFVSPRRFGWENILEIGTLGGWSFNAWLYSHGIW